MPLLLRLLLHGSHGDGDYYGVDRGIGGGVAPVWDISHFVWDKSQ
jgi:hypothetical protein